MLSSGGTRKAPGLKGDTELHTHDRVPHNSRTSVHNYTEKSLLVLQNYVFMEKKRRHTSHMFRGQGDAFMDDDTNGISIDVPTELWETAKVTKKNEKAAIKKKVGGKPRSWMPNGGGMKPYNSSEVHKSVPPEECIIDVKAVKPKVDTWFRVKPQNRVKQTLQDAPQEDCQEVSKTGKSFGQPQNPNAVMKRAATTTVRHRVHSELNEACESERDQKVKNLTLFWNDHLQKNPLTIAQKSSTANTGKQRPGDHVKPKSRHLVTGRPKSVGSDGVIQEHTLQPSKILSEKKRLSSVEDILVFAKLTGYRKSGGDGPILGKPQVCHGKRGPGNAVGSYKNVPRILRRTEKNPLKNIEAKPDRVTPQGRGTTPVKRSHRHDHPKFVVRLHPRWILALRVLTLSFRPLVDMWKRKCPQENAGLLKLTGVDLLPNEPCASGKIIKETLATSVKKCTERFLGQPSSEEQRQGSGVNSIQNLLISTIPTFRRDPSSRSADLSGRFGKLKRLARQGMSDTLRILTDSTQFRRMKETSRLVPYTVLRTGTHSFFRSERLPLVTEPLPRSPEFRAAAGARVLKTASLEVFPRGVRVALYVEYQLVFSFILVQSTLLAIVLFIKWLQEYTM